MSSKYRLDNIIQLLKTQYSFEEYQTYPRPGHPDINKRCKPYFTMIAIIISLRTTTKNEIVATENFLKKYKSAKDVDDASLEDIANTIKAAGMQNKKAVTIKKATEYFVNDMNSNWHTITNAPTIEKARIRIMEIPGIGIKAADCIMQLGLEIPTMIIDINMFRVSSRVFKDNSGELKINRNRDINKIKIFFNSILPQDAKYYQLVHTMMFAHGKNICTSKPKCKLCKIKQYCDYSKN